MKLYRWSSWAAKRWGPGYVIVMAVSEGHARLAANARLLEYVKDRYPYCWEDDDEDGEWNAEEREKLLAMIHNDLRCKPRVYDVGQVIVIEGSD